MLLAVLLVAQVEAERALAGIVVGEIAAHTVELGLPLPARFAFRRFDLRHVCTEAGEPEPGQGPGRIHGQLDHPDARERMPLRAGLPGEGRFGPLRPCRVGACRPDPHGHARYRLGAIALDAAAGQQHGVRGNLRYRYDRPHRHARGAERLEQIRDGTALRAVFQQAVDVSPVRKARRTRRIAWIAGERALADRLDDRGPVLVGGRTDQYPAIERAIGIPRAAQWMATAGAEPAGLPVLQQRYMRPELVGNDLDQAQVDHLRLRRKKRRRDRDAGDHRGAQFADRHACKLRLALGPAGHGHQPPQGLHQGVGGRFGKVRVPQTLCGNTADDRSGGVAAGGRRRGGRIIQAVDGCAQHARQGIRIFGREQDDACDRKRLRPAEPARLDPGLAPDQQSLEGGRRRCDRSRVDSLLDPDHPGPQAGEQEAAGADRQPAGAFNDDQAGQRAIGALDHRGLQRRASRL